MYLRKSVRVVAVALIVIAGIAALTPAPSAQSGVTMTHGMAIPTGDFMVFWTPERLTQARAWFQANSSSFSPRGYPPESTALDNAFLYLMTGNTTAAQSAVNWAAATNFYSTGPGDAARWYGEKQILVFSWLKNLFTADQRRTTIENINRAIANDLTKLWGGPSDPANNYNWGFTRNALLWGIASYNENYTDSTGRTQRQIAEGFIDNALVTRWQNVMVPFFSGPDRGGTLPEGSHYGPYLMEYFGTSLVTTRILGRPMTADTNFYKEAVMGVIYATTQKPTNGSVRNPITPRYQVFSYGDEQDNDGYPPAGKHEYGNFMTFAASEWRNTPLGQYARYWLNRVRPDVDYHIRATDTSLGQNGLSFDGLPLDYYAPGPGYFYTRDTWRSGSSDKPTVMVFQLNQYYGAHSQCEAGTFQILRNDRWLSKEAPGRSVTYAGPNGTSSVLDYSVWPHNGITVDNNSLGNCMDSRTARVLRVESRPSYAYAAVDLSTYHKIAAAPIIIREFVNVRDLNTLIVFDRVRSTQDLAKTALIHFPTNPTIAGNIITGTNVTEQMRVTSLTPLISGQTATFTVIDESSAGGGSGSTWEPQFRLQIDTRGRLDSYHINVLQARSVGDPDVTATLNETSTSFVITLTRPGAATTVLTFEKGMASNGGSIQVGSTNSPFTTTVQSIAVTDNGVVWDGTPTNLPRPPANVRIIR